MMHTQTENDPGAIRKGKTPQASQARTRTVSPEVPMDFTFLDKPLSNLRYYILDAQM